MFPINALRNRVQMSLLSRVRACVVSRGLRTKLIAPSELAAKLYKHSSALFATRKTFLEKKRFSRWKQWINENVQLSTVARSCSIPAAVHDAACVTSARAKFSTWEPLKRSKSSSLCSQIHLIASSPPVIFSFNKIILKKKQIQDFMFLPCLFDFAHNELLWFFFLTQNWCRAWSGCVWNVLLLRMIVSGSIPIDIIQTVASRDSDMVKRFQQTHLNNKARRTSPLLDARIEF